MYVAQRTTDLWSVLAHEDRRKVLLFLVLNSPARVLDVTRALGLSQSQASKHLKALVGVALTNLEGEMYTIPQPGAALTTLRQVHGAAVGTLVTEIERLNRLLAEERAEEATYVDAHKTLEQKAKAAAELDADSG